VEILRREENESLGIVGVESVEILELGYRRKSAFNSGRDKKVYNLEIADNHNYFANNVLVSNCHMAQGGTKTQRGKNFIALSKDDNCMAVYLLTGTPMKNGRPINLFPLLKAIKHPIVQDQSFYHRRYCDAKATRFSQWDTSGAKNLDELFLKTKDLILRKTKKECLDLPDKLRVIREIEPSKKALEDYNNKLAELKKRFEERIASGEVSGESQALVALGMIRQSSSLAKIETAIELCEELLEQNNQIVVFTEFLETAKRIKNYFLDDAVLLTGETKEDDRQLAVDLFQTNRARIFVGTIKAGGVGITLTASSTVILIDRPYTPGDAEQAEDRLHRIGQKNPVTSIWIQYGETDKWIDDLLQSKMENINLVLSGVKKKMKFNSINEIAKHALRKTLLNQSE
jgi:SNF2 family DNA or RNA helicase